MKDTLRYVYNPNLSLLLRFTILSRDELLEVLKTGKVDYIRVEFIDVLGNVRGRSLRRIEFEDNMDEGFPFPESVLTMDYSDKPLYETWKDISVVPDPNTFVFIPYLERTSRILGFVLGENGEAHPFCSRNILRRAISRLEDMDLRAKASFSLSFYLTKEVTDSIVPADNTRAFSPEGLLVEQDFLKNMIKYLEMLDVPVQRVNKSVGPGQYELRTMPSDIATAVDNLVKTKEVISDVASMHGLKATFMPKPFTDFPGNHMEFHMKLEDSSGKNFLSNTSDPNGLGLSEGAYSFSSGVISHINAISAFSFSTINSYKRLRSSPLIPDVGKSRNYAISPSLGPRNTLELSLRFMDPLANSYLSVAGILISGVEGIKGNTKEVRQESHYSIPRDLRESLRSIGKDSLFNDFFGNELIRAYTSLKEREADSYEGFTTDWEIDAYLRMGW